MNKKEALIDQPVAWRCKDFADGWILHHNKAAAEAYQKETGCLMEPLYTRPAKQRQRNVIENWYFFDGDENKLTEYLMHTEWDYFIRAGKDRQGKMVVFLRVGEDTTGAIRSAKGDYQTLLDILDEILEDDDINGNR